MMVLIPYNDMISIDFQHVFIFQYYQIDLKTQGILKIDFIWG